MIPNADKLGRVIIHFYMEKRLHGSANSSGSHCVSRYITEPEASKTNHGSVILVRCTSRRTARRRSLEHVLVFHVEFTQ